MKEHQLGPYQKSRSEGGPFPFHWEPPEEWSPDGSLIAFNRVTYTRAGVRLAVHTIDPTGSGERLLVENAFDPNWSPDGRRLLLTSTRDRHGETSFQECSPSGEIYLVGAEGNGLRRLTTSKAADLSPAWAPDGRRIAFVSDRSNADEHEYEISLMAVDGSGLRRLARNDVWDGEPDWR